MFQQHPMISGEVDFERTFPRFGRTRLTYSYPCDTIDFLTKLLFPARTSQYEMILIDELQRKLLTRRKATHNNHFCLLGHQRGSTWFEQRCYWPKWLLKDGTTIENTFSDSWNDLRDQISAFRKKLCWDRGNILQASGIVSPGLLQT